MATRKHPTGRDLTDDESTLWAEFDRWSKILANQGATKNGAGTSASYSQAYTKLVQAGLAPKLRGRYR